MSVDFMDKNKNHISLLKVYSRIFNHHSIIQSNLQLTAKGEERVDASSSMIEHSLKSNAIAHDTVDGIDVALQNNLAPILASCLAVKQTCDAILLNQGVHTKTDYVKQEAERRQTDWHDFMANMAHRSSQIGEEYNQKLESIHKHYSALEHQSHPQT